ncbi:MAG TPA: hypothetical protein VM513_21380 [Kofleriaceae bacterium]|jgi:tetratricopeptide (TPR) repeat protein|nr:hypothetical protein [Kofleriaceae bacterium]
MNARTLALALILAPALVGAEPRKIPRHAKQLAAQGRAAHAAGAYGDAILAYKEAYELAPSASLLFNLAQAYRLAGNCHAAVQMYRRFIATEPAAEVRSLAQRHLSTVEHCADAPSRLALASVPEYAPPVDLTASAAPLYPGRTKRRVGVGMMVAGGIAAAFAGYYALDARASSATVEAAYARGVRWQEVRPIAEEGERSAKIGQGLAIGGVLALAGGVTLYVLGRRAERAAQASFVPTRGGAEVSWAWRF